MRKYHNVYVAPWGTDRPTHGSRKRPVASISFAVERAQRNGNVMLLSGHANATMGFKAAELKFVIGLPDRNSEQ